MGAAGQQAGPQAEAAFDVNVWGAQHETCCSTFGGFPSLLRLLVCFSVMLCLRVQSVVFLHTSGSAQCGFC